MEKYALFIYESLKKTKCREFVPSRDEIEALIHRQEMTSTVYCHGGGSCKITINSHTTAGEVRDNLHSPFYLPHTCPKLSGLLITRV
jgi:myosin X